MDSLLAYAPTAPSSANTRSASAAVIGRGVSWYRMRRHR
jgi:hypothetical protein